MKYIKFILLFLFFVSCQESKNKDNIKKNESKKVTKEYDFSDSMKFKYEDITSVEVYSFLNKLSNTKLALQAWDKQCFKKAGDRV